MFFAHIFSILFGIFCILNHVAAEKYKIVETLNGQVRGVQKRTIWRNIPFYSFKGIPYAKPPVGDLRLKAPELVESWEPAVLNAFEHGNTCVQPENKFPQSENCLTLNIYVPADVKSNEKLSVLFYIHGGGYVKGASNYYFCGPDFIIEKQTILVTINYRLGLLGFLSLDSPEYSGNMGLKDQQLALKWVHSNIDRFGGDNKRITIFGESAGSTSTHFQVLSTESRKYFRNAILMSGVVDNYWAMSQNYDHLEYAHQIARDLGEPKNNYNDLVEFYKLAPIEKLLEYSTALKFSPLLQLAFAPVIERKDAKQPFLTDRPEKLYDTSKVDVDVLFTVTSVEILLFLSSMPTIQELEQNDFSFPLPFRRLTIPIESEKYRNFISEIRNFYLNDTTTGVRALQQYATMLSDMNFNYGIHKAVQTHAAKSSAKAYYYRFSVDSKLNVFKRLNPDTANLAGASHADDLLYVFRSQIAESIYDDIKNSRNDEQSKVSLQTIDHVTRIMTNFAKYGEPSPQGNPIDVFWPIQYGEINFLDITNDGLIVGRDPNKEAVELWSSIEKRVQNLPMDLPEHNHVEL